MGQETNVNLKKKEVTTQEEEDMTGRKRYLLYLKIHTIYKSDVYINIKVAHSFRLITLICDIHIKWVQCETVLKMWTYWVLHSANRWWIEGKNSVCVYMCSPNKM